LQGNSDPEELWDFGTVRHVSNQATVGRSHNKSGVQPQDEYLTWSGTRRADNVSDISSGTSSTLTAVPNGVRLEPSDTSTVVAAISTKGELPRVPGKSPEKYNSGATLKHSLPNGATEAKMRVTARSEPSVEYDEYDDDYQDQAHFNHDDAEDLPTASILDSVVLPALASLFPRVSSQEARVALSSLQRAFTEAERVIPGVTLELVNEIVDSVEHVDDDTR